MKNPFSTVRGTFAYGTMGTCTPTVLHVPFFVSRRKDTKMPEDERKDVGEEMNEENDAREEDIVEDVDADTKDVEEKADDDYSDISRRIDRLETLVQKAIGGIDALRDAQSIIVDNGGTIQESEPDSMDLGVDDFVAPAELDLII